LIWVGWDYLTGRKPGMISGVNGDRRSRGDHSGAGYVNGWGAIAMGVIASTIVYFGLNYLSRVATVPQCRRHPRRGLHPRDRRPRRRSAGRDLRRPGHGRLSGRRQDPSIAAQGVLHGNWHLLEWQALAACS